jgi:hypothetical protein
VIPGLLKLGSGKCLVKWQFYNESVSAMSVLTWTIYHTCQVDCLSPWSVGLTDYGFLIRG